MLLKNEKRTVFILFWRAYELNKAREKVEKTKGDIPMGKEMFRVV